MQTQTQLLDPVTHTSQASEFRLPAGKTVLLGGLRLACPAAWNPTPNLQLNSSSGYYSLIQTLSLVIDGQTVAELRNAHQYLAYIAALGSADAGNSVAEHVSFSTQRLTPWMRRAGGPQLGNTIIAAQQQFLPTTAATAEGPLLYLEHAFPILRTMEAVDIGNHQIQVIVTYVSSYENVLPLATGPEQAATVITRPYLVFEELVGGQGMPLSTMEYHSIESDMLVVPAVGAGVAQTQTTQSRAFVGSSVDGLLLVKGSPTAAIGGTLYSGGLDASYAMLRETVRTYVDGKQVTPLLTNSTLLSSHAPDHRAPVILQRPLYENFANQADGASLGLLGDRHYMQIDGIGKVNQSLQLDYGRTGGLGPQGVAAINLYMFAKVRMALVVAGDGTFKVVKL